jgi:hypothetical protein
MAKNSGKKWSSAELTKLFFYWKEGETFETIAKRLGRTKGAVQQKLYEYDIHTDERIRESAADGDDDV